jgi:hypothetical protein
MTDHARRCRSCSAWLIFAKTPQGKTLPVDAVPQKRVVLEPDASGTPIARVVDTYVSHFATCPNAAQHRKPRGAAGK